MQAFTIHWSNLLLESCPINESKIESLRGGYEAETYKLTHPNNSYILKVWSKQGKIDIETHFYFLQHLLEAGVAVSNVFGWGNDDQNNPVLLTSFDGEPISKLDKHILNTLVEQLLSIHQLDDHVKQKLNLPNHNFVNYFFLRLVEHSDLSSALNALLSQTQLATNHVIHGDYNLGNVVVAENKYTTIDWSNGQLGDARYDIAWSTFLMNVYVTEQLADSYRKLFLAKTSYSMEELQLFEAIACIRFILLLRHQHLTIQVEQLSRLQHIMLNNTFLVKLQLTI